ncbi:hypothetical protein SNE40_016664 [Patella caerulea]|uniref:GH3 domain-containing protein n=1 Tax=Patella caerulea TaxID=87958 RepID=A0AAN8JAF2_PATCE
MTYIVLFIPIILIGIYLYLDFKSQKINSAQKSSEAFKIYFFKWILIQLGRYRRNKLEKNTKDVRKVQESFLLKQLKLAERTEYGLKYEFSKIKSVTDYLSRHPLTRYSHYENYIDRMMKGEVNILTATQPSIFAVTSGTSGKSNIIPMVKRQQTIFFLDGIALLFQVMKEFFPKTCQIQKHLKFFYDPIKWRMSEAGIKIGPNSSSPSNSKSVLYMYSTPIPAYRIVSEPELLYIHLLFALKEKLLGMIEANFTSIVYNSFTALDNVWDDLISDIEKGRLKESLDVEDSIRNELNKLLHPDKERAEELRKAKQKGNIGLAHRIWPQCNLVIGADSGSFELYASKLRQTYLKDIPIYSPIYAATEGLLGVNIWPKQLPSRYLLIPTVQFFEFIPLCDCDQDQPKTFLMHEVKEGESYELVITNATCLYRYRFGDVVKVTGLHNQCPIIEFLYRQGQFLSVRGEKTSESLFYCALCKTIDNWSDVQLVDYCCAESVLVDDQTKDQSTLPSYHVYLELKNHFNSINVQQLQTKLDENLGSESYVYSSFRQKKSIGPIQIHLVQDGSFHRLRDFFLKNTSSSFNQYKVPRVLKTKMAVDFITEQCY